MLARIVQGCRPFAVKNIKKFVTYSLLVTGRSFANTSYTTKRPYHNQKNYKADWTIRQLQMTTCYDMWDDRPNGARLIVSYIDTASSVTDRKILSELPSVLVMNSCLSDEPSLLSVLHRLAERGFRIIIPFTLGCGGTRGESRDDEVCFQHLLGERSVFMIDFMNSLGLKKSSTYSISMVYRCDLGIGHYLGCDVAVVLSANFQLFKSLVFISPMPRLQTPSIIEPLFLTHRVLQWSINVFLRPLSNLYMSMVFRRRLIKYSMIDDDDVSVQRARNILCILCGVQPETICSMSTVFRVQRIPLLWIYSTLDHCNDIHSQRKYAELFGIAPSNTVTVGDTTTLSRDGSDVVRAIEISECTTRRGQLSDALVEYLTDNISTFLVKSVNNNDL